MNLPVYELKIDPNNDSFVDAIALVDAPAIESDFLLFNRQGSQKQMFTYNDEKMEIMGLAMKADKHIYRRDEDGKEYNVFFSKDTIRDIIKVFMKKGLQSQLNLDHTAVPAKSFIFQIFQIDKDRGIVSPNGIDGEDGDMVIVVQVEDKAVWADIKAGKQKGFSIEGIFQYFSKIKRTEEDKDKKATDLIQYVLNKINAN